ncbi:DUF1292 domain-containing protein [Thalassobacillus sp. CUG 92003]|uniref:DUF1292 domain-containing protein n=1 Tax=Thalassobacillus sp. CUG 92003 TaxID=2736641 RepID=UPI0015E7C687|nr:DUF1292 domain-containing protein [Thalassobacillus sp. CUG 92003]
MPHSRKSEEPELIVFKDEFGRDVEYHVDAIIEMDHKEYVLYSGGGDMLFSRIKHIGDDVELCDITEEEVNALAKAYQEGIAMENE